MDKVACYLLAAKHLSVAYTHIADPLGPESLALPEFEVLDGFVSHFFAIIGCFCVFTGTVLLSAATMSDAAHRKCILGAQHSAAALRCCDAAQLRCSPPPQRAGECVAARAEC